MIIHILLKDARRSWPYVAVVAAITATLACLTPWWTPVYFAGGRRLNSTVDTLEILLLAAWWFAVAHAIHGESLVGDRQFWITRPYSWKRLFAAKVLFCVVFLMLPFLISDCVILSVEGFSPASLWSSLLWRQCQIAGLFVLPAFLLATLTRGIGQFILSFLSAIIALFLLVRGNEIYVPDTILLAAAAFAVVLWQYARRQTAYARAVVIVLLACLTQWPGSSPYVLASAPGNPEIQLRFTPKRHMADRSHSPDPQTVEVCLPIELTGRDRQLLDFHVASVEVEHGRDRFTAQGGPYRQDSLKAEERFDWVSLWLPRDQFNRLHDDPVTLHLVFGIVLYDVRSSVILRRREEWTAVPGFGAASLHYEPRTTLWLRLPLGEPSEKLVATMFDSGSRVTGRLEWSSAYPHGSSSHITPVVCFAQPFLGGALPDDFNRVVLTVERPVGIIRRDLRIESLRLADYVY